MPTGIWGWRQRLAKQGRLNSKAEVGGPPLDLQARGANLGFPPPARKETSLRARSWLLQKLGSSNELRTRNREAREARNAPETWAQDKVGAHLAGTLSFLAHRGMLDLRLETLDPVGGLDGIIVPLRELRLEQSLAATANRPRPRM